MSKKKKKTVVVMYQGERLTMMQGLTHLFTDKDGGEHCFRGIRGAIFGHCYLMVNDTMERRPTLAEAGCWEHTEKEELVYEGAKLAVANFRASRRREMELRMPNRKIVQAVDLLRPFYLSMTDFDRVRFMRWVSQECSKKKRGRR